MQGEGRWGVAREERRDGVGERIGKGGGRLFSFMLTFYLARF